jgi:hypothetical protein
MNWRMAALLNMRLTYSHVTNQVIQSFSTGGMFTPVTVPQPGTVMTTGATPRQGITSVFGSVQLPSSP